MRYTSKPRLSEKIKQKLKGYSKYLFLLICALLAVSLIRNILRVRRAQVRIQEAEERVESLRDENIDLKSRVEEIQTQEYTEKQIRDKLGLAKEGEVVLVLPDTETLKKLAPKVPEEQDSLPDPIWKKWLKLFL